MAGSTEGGVDLEAVGAAASVSSTSSTITGRCPTSLSAPPSGEPSTDSPPRPARADPASGRSSLDAQPGRVRGESVGRVDGLLRLRPPTRVPDFDVISSAYHHGVGPDPDDSLIAAGSRTRPCWSVSTSRSPRRGTGRRPGRARRRSAAGRPSRPAPRTRTWGRWPRSRRPSGPASRLRPEAHESGRDGYPTLGVHRVPVFAGEHRSVACSPVRETPRVHVAGGSWARAPLGAPIGFRSPPVSRSLGQWLHSLPPTTTFRHSPDHTPALPHVNGRSRGPRGRRHRPLTAGGTTWRAPQSRRRSPRRRSRDAEESDAHPGHRAAGPRRSRRSVHPGAVGR